MPRDGLGGEMQARRAGELVQRDCGGSSEYAEEDQGVARLLGRIVEGIVFYPDDVRVKVKSSPSKVKINFFVAPGDEDEVMRSMHAIRTILCAAGRRYDRVVDVFLNRSDRLERADRAGARF